MFDSLLPYYNRELAFLRRLSGEFAKAHPKIAANLRISGENVDDPHVARLIESVALMNARIRFKLEDEFTEISEALLELLYPHFLAPWPSMGIVQMHGAADLGNVHTIPRGTGIDIQATGEETCRYRTTTALDIWPARVASAAIHPAPFSAPSSPRVNSASAVLKLVLEARNEDFQFGRARPDRLRFFLRGSPDLAFGLYELLLNNVLLLGVSGAEGKDAQFVEAAQVRAGGMGPDDAVLPAPPTAQTGYRLLSEYFAFPEKFLFVDIEGLSGAIPQSASGTVEIYFYLNRVVGELNRNVNADAFALGCVPVVNLFEQMAEPINVTHTTHEYRVIPDARRASAMEIYAITDVEAIDRDGGRHSFLPFYSIRHTRPGTAGYWYASRHRAETDTSTNEMRISVVDLDFSPDQPVDTLLQVRTLCTNGTLPAAIPYGAGLPNMAFVEGAGAVERLEALTPMTPTRRNRWRDGARWRLVSHLALNHLSLTSPEDGTDALREILKLYDVGESDETAALIEGVHKVSARPGTARFPSGPGAPPWAAAVCRGVDIEVVFDPARFSGNGMLMLGNILDEFFSQYCAINSFTRLTARVRGQTGVFRRWPARAGKQPLL